MNDWQPIETSPEGVIVETKIDDAEGVRNQAPLRRRRALWFITDEAGDDVMYVYYRPTHWRPLP